MADGRGPYATAEEALRANGIDPGTVRWTSFEMGFADGDAMCNCCGPSLGGDHDEACDVTQWHAFLSRTGTGQG